jgi:prepilin-type N-terminal cleavage/methylation domain-containing protein
MTRRRATRWARQSAKGFTLLEVIVASVMVATLMASLYVSLSIAFKASASAYSSVENVRKMDQVMDFIKSDLQSALVPNGIFAGSFVGGAGNNLPGYQVDDVVFYSAQADRQPVAGTGDVRKIEYTCQIPDGSQDPALVRLVNRPDWLAMVVTDPQQEVICRGVSSFLMRYFDGSAWVDAWDSTAQGNVLPVAVEVTVELTNPAGGDKPLYRATRVFALPCGLNINNTATDSATPAATPTPSAGGG